MELAILSRSPTSYSTRRFAVAAADRGHDVRVLDTLGFAIDLSRNAPDLQYRGRPIWNIDAILPRVGASITYFGTSVVRQFEQMDVYTPNTSFGIANSRDKLRALQILSRHDIGIPASTFVSDRKGVRAGIRRVGGAPVVIKLREGTQGIGVILARDANTAEAIVETLQSTGTNVIVQRYVAESNGQDTRAFVVGDRVVAAIRRTASGNDFRSNIHRGGHAKAIELDDETAQIAVRAAQIMGLRVAGVDMLISDSGPLILEVNSSPGLKGIESVTGLDVAGAVVDYMSNQVGFPELDVRQRLGVSTGYGVAEILIRDESEYVGKTIDHSGLRDRDITVLSLHRDTLVIPNPRTSRTLEANDRLLCFGSLEAMKSLIPERRKRRAKVQTLPTEPLASDDS